MNKAQRQPKAPKAAKSLPKTKTQITKRKLSTKAQPKRKLSTKAKQSLTSHPPQSQLTPLTSLFSTKRFFSTKQNDQGPSDNDQEPPQGGEEGASQPDAADPLVSLQKRVANQANEIASLQRQLNDDKMIIEEWQSKSRQLQERVKHEIEEQHSIHDRYKREIGDVKKFSVGKFAKGLLEGVDALEAAAKATDAALQRTQDEKFIQLAEGLKMTTALFQKALSAEGIKKFESLGQTVDPNLHFITAQLPHPSAPAGTITHLLKEGYHIHDRVLRPAQVVVAHSPNAV